MLNFFYPLLFFSKGDLELLLDRVNDLVEFRVDAILEEMSGIPLCQLPGEEPVSCEEFLQMTKVIRKLKLLFKLYFVIHFSIKGVFSSVTQSWPTLCDPMNRSTPSFPVRHQLPEFTQTHVHRVSDAIQPSHPLSSPSPPALNLSHNQGFF